MSGDAHVQFWEGLGVKLPGPTRQIRKGSKRAYLVRSSFDSGLSATRSRHQRLASSAASTARP